MELTENQIIERNVKHCMHCLENKIISFLYKWTCCSCQFDVIKQKTGLTKVHCEKPNFF